MPSGSWRRSTRADRAGCGTAIEVKVSQDVNYRSGSKHRLAMDISVLSIYTQGVQDSPFSNTLFLDYSAQNASGRAGHQPLPWPAWESGPTSKGRARRRTNRRVTRWN